jgi:hypothetical protein
MKLSEHVTVLETPQDREYFTRHGLHLNGYGKEAICRQLALSIGKLYQHTETPPISLSWEDKLAISTERTASRICNNLSNTVLNDGTEDSSKLNEHDAYRISRRQKKLLSIEQLIFYGNFKYK